MSFWNDTKVLVTGANGFAGSRLCRLLIEQGASVYALVRDNSHLLNIRDIIPKINLVYGDIRYAETVMEATRRMDYVFNLAAKVNIEETRRSPSETLRTNVNGALNVAHACKINGVRRLVHVSTCHVYGNIPESALPINEETLPCPHDIYSISKYSGELVVKTEQRNGLDTVITRAFNHYGPGQTGDFFVAKVVKQLLEDRIPVLGSGKPTRDYCYVDDIVKGYVLSCEKGRNGEIYHFSSGQEISISSLYDRICSAAGKYPEAVWKTERSNDMSRSFGHFDKANKELGWRPETPLKKGLKLTVEWWRNNMDLIKNLN